MSILRRLVTAVFGNISWQPPGWARATGTSLRAHPRAVGSVVLLLAICGVGGLRAYEWYQKRPKPVKVAVYAEAIPVTKLEDKLHPASLVVRFRGSAAPIEYVGKLVRTGIRMEPAADGVWHWKGDRELEFKPKNDWPADQKYRITFDKSVISPQVLLEQYRVEVKTPPFAAVFKKQEFYQDPNDPTIKRVVATIEFTHSIAPGELEKHLTLAMLGGSAVFNTNGAAFNVSYGQHQRTAFVMSAPLTLPEREDFMKLALDKKMSTSQGGAKLQNDIEQKVRVPDRYSFFKIESTEGQITQKENGDPEQLVMINTTAAVKPEEIAKSLEIYLLPKKPTKADDKTTDDASTGDESDSDSDSDDDDSEDTQQAPPQWSSPREVDEEILKGSRPVKFTLVPSDEENAKLHIFKIKVETDGCLYVRIRKGVKALGDFALGADYDAVIPVPQPKSQVNIQGDGGVLALNGERKLSIRSRGVEMIEYQVARVPADQINHLVSQTEGSFQNPDFINSHFDETNIARIAIEKQAINVENRYKANYSTFDFTSHLAPAKDGGSPMQGLFFLKARAFDTKTKKYLRDVVDSRFIIVTDIGILVKQNADGSRDVYLQSLKSREPMGGVTVDILARNGVPAVSGVTSGDGHVAFPTLGKPVREREPVAIVARHGNDVSFIPYARDDRQLDFSRFDIDGIQSVSGAELDAFVFTERGVYRPGDEVHVAFTVKQHNWGGNLTGLPVETEMVDARGMSVQVKKMALPAGRLAEFTCTTAYESPTGDYTFNVYFLRNGKRDTLLGSASALVKEFLPDRMKIDSHLSTPPTKGWITPDAVRASVNLRNLYGTPATNRRIVSHMYLSPAKFRFDEYRDYSFFDWLLEGKEEKDGETVELGEKTTDDNGAAEFDLDLERFTDATYEMNFYAEGFEAEGGRSVNAESSTMVSPLEYVVGCKPDGDFNYLKVGSEHSIGFIAIDNTLKKIAIDDLQLNVIEHTYVSVLKKQENGTYEYESVKKEVNVSSQAVTISEEGLRFAIPTAKPGNYFVELREKDSDQRVSKCEFSVVGLGAVSRSLDKNAELNVKLNREQYNAGDDIEVNITAPYTGSGLITIERDKVYAHQWFKADKTGSVQHIKLPEGFDGTGYINVSFIRALDSKEIFMSPLSYGVVPFTANREKRTLQVGLTAAKLAKPGEPLKIDFKTSRPSKIVVYAVDEGILQVTGYELPSPLSYFFRKYGLMVRTSQIVDLILPEYSILKSSAFGGDGEARHLNPFKRVTEKPVVFWSGVLDADATEREVTYHVPDYFNGTLKVMAVAVSQDAVGSVEQESVIRGPFVITPGVPTLAAPGDQFEVGVTVANNVTGSGENAAVNLAAEVSEHLEIVKAPAQPMHIAEGREASVVFTVRAKEKLGSASITFKASANGAETKLRSTLSVRPPVPLMTELRSGNFTKESATVPIERVILPEYRHLESVVSSVPLGLAHGLDVYLKNYPNGCSEQISSGAFCRLMLADEADFALPRTEIFAQLEKTFDVLRRRQNDQGAFGYWSAESHAGIDFISVYVMHFLIEAKASGFAPPADVFQSGLRNLQKMVVLEPHNLTEARTLAYAIYLLTREEVITTNYILNLRDYLDKNCTGKWQNDLTGVYLAGSLAILKKDADAQKIIGQFKIGSHDKHCWYDFYQPLGADSQYIAIVARHFPGMLRQISAADFEAIVAPIGRGEYNTLSAAYAVMALKSYSQHMAANPPALSMHEIAKDKHETEIAADGKLLKRAEFSAAATVLRFGATPAIKGMGAYYQVIETGFDKQLPTKVIHDGLEIHREFLDEKGNETTVAKLGVPLTVKLVIRSLKMEPVTNVAILDLLPGGFEVVGSSLRPGTESAGCDYVDVREDRAVFFTTVDMSTKVITYQIKPGNRGTFVVPPVFAESMYDRAIKARGMADHLEVVEAK